MIAKIISQGQDRDEAIARMLSALGAVAVEGVATNAVFLGRLLDHPAFRAGDIYTGFAAEHAGELLKA